jgi:hypothetical protein
VLDRRLQLLLDEDRYQRLVAVARERGVSIAAVIREAIDRGLPPTDRRRAAAASRILAAPGMPVPEPDELREELEQLRGRRG